MDLMEERDTIVSERVRGKLTGIRGLWLIERIESLRSAEISVAGEIEEEEAEEGDVEGDEDESGGVRPATTGVTGADCAHEV